jgi:cysteinyl-tRNA synthetase
MSKSLNNFYRLDDLAARGYDPLAYRYFCFTGHYRSQLNFTWESLTSAQRALENLRAEILKLRAEAAHNPTPQGEAGGEVAFKQRFLEAINDDLNMPQALATNWDLIRSSELSPVQKLGLIEDFDRVLGVKLAEPLGEGAVPPEVRRLLEQRHQARAARNWGESDRLRAEISDLGFAVEDGPGGQKVRPKRFGE